MARQFLFDVWHYFLLQKLERSADERVAAIAAKALKEVTYHVRRSSDMVVRLGDGTAESHAKMQAAIDDAWRFTGELFLTTPWTRTCRARHRLSVVRVARALGPPRGRGAGRGHAVRAGRRSRQPSRPSRRPPGRHSEELGYVLAEMQFLPRAYPGAKW